MAEKRCGADGQEGLRRREMIDLSSRGVSGVGCACMGEGGGGVGLGSRGILSFIAIA